MSSGKLFFIILIPAGLLFYFVIIPIFLQIGFEATPTTLFESIWHEQNTLVTSGIAGWFKAIPWALKYLGEYPLHVVFGLTAIWKLPLSVVCGAIAAGQVSGLFNVK